MGMSYTPSCQFIRSNYHIGSVLLTDRPDHSSPCGPLHLIFPMFNLCESSLRSSFVSVSDHRTLMVECRFKVDVPKTLATQYIQTSD